jgi:iron(III) transport system ATP-binding protein
MKGRFLSLLGPSGCGKTTTLRCIAGLEKPDGGEVVVDGEVFNSVAKGIMIMPNKRNIGMVFQSYAVWPHMNVFDNIAYGLRMNKVRKAEIKRRVEDVTKLVGLRGLIERPVTKLSGGQQQRVAVARALVYEPRLLLFDEPLSNLDAKLRERMRLELIKLQREIGITSIYVTHDQAEAMVISDEIIVMQDGKIEQIGSAGEIYTRPKSKFVADFIGTANFLEGKAIKKKDVKGDYGIVKLSDEISSYEAMCIMPEEIQEGDSVALFFRPENTTVTVSQKGDGMNIFVGKVSNLIYLGSYTDCRVHVGPKEIRAQISPKEKMKENDRVFIEINPEHCLCIKY